ncbi:MAG: hypothetical protein AB8G05_13205 [Oligoflexales bacterium]
MEETVVDKRRLNKPFSANGLGVNDPICKAIGLSKSGLSLTSQDIGSMIALQENTQLALQDELPEGVKVVADPATYTPITTGLGLLQRNKETVTLGFEFKGIPFCSHKIIAYMDEGNLVHYGNLPKIPEFDKSTSLPEWPDVKSAAKVIFNRIKQEPAFLDYQITDLMYKDYNVAACLGFDSSGTLLPFWDFSQVRIGNHQARIHAIADEKDFYKDQYGDVFDRGFFTAEGSGDVLQRVQNGTSYSFEINRVDLPNISGGNFLCNSKFVPDKAFSTDKTFFFTTESANFALFQVTIFYNANIHSDWVKSLPSSEGWPGPQIRLTIDDENDGINNTAVYYPNGNEVPQIQLGDGDGRALKNLWKDPEVVSHELGHHIVYRKLTETRGESLILHEGLSDYFVFARTNDPCLAETICPVTSSVCNSTQCLRTADNDFTKNGSNLPSEPHKISQLISGMLWDIGKNIGQQPTANIVYQAINYLKEDSGYADFLIALMSGDKDLNQGKNACLIKDTAIARGFDELDNIDCNQFITQ